MDNRVALMSYLGCVPLNKQPVELIQWRMGNLESLEDLNIRYATTTALVLGDEWQLFRSNPSWLLMRVDVDPFYGDPRGYPMPKLIIDRLKAIRDAQIRLDDVWVAHEILQAPETLGRELTVEDFLPKLPKYRSWLYPLLSLFMQQAKEAMVRTDPILFGVKTVDRVSDLYLIGSWIYGY